MVGHKGGNNGLLADLFSPLLRGISVWQCNKLMLLPSIGSFDLLEDQVSGEGVAWIWFYRDKEHTIELAGANHYVEQYSSIVFIIVD